MRHHSWRLALLQQLNGAAASSLKIGCCSFWSHIYIIRTGRPEGVFRKAERSKLGERQEIVAQLSESDAAAQPDSESRATARPRYSFSYRSPWRASVRHTDARFRRQPNETPARESIRDEQGILAAGKRSPSEDRYARRRFRYSPPGDANKAILDSACGILADRPPAHDDQAASLAERPAAVRR